MKSVAEIWRLIDAIAKPLPAAQRPLATSLGAVLAAPVHADADQPAFDRSAIDGFALKVDSPPGSYRIVGSIEPGAESAVQPGPGEACRIFTGAEVPADCGLVMVEDSECRDNEVQTRQPARSRLIRRRGSSVRAGQCLLQVGTRIGPGEIAVLASVGAVHVEVIPPPRLLHLTTGSEIVPAKLSPRHGQIRNTNAPLIQALAQQAGSPIAANVHVDEQARSLVNAVEAADPFDILLVSGGSSVGDHDHTPAAFEALGFEILSRKVNAKPGKPLIIARRGKQLAFGIPGNPVSHFATWHAFIRRAIDRLAGRPTQGTHSVRLQAGAELSSSDRETFWPATIEIREGILHAKPLPWLDSGDLSALAGIQALIHLPAGQASPSAGDSLSVLQVGTNLPSI